jgi:hypothetical protein
MMAAIIITFLLVFVCLSYFLLLFLVPERTTPQSLVSDSPELRIEGLSAVCVSNADLLFGQDDYRKLRTRPALKSVSDRFWRDRRRIVLRWLGDLEGDVRLLWKFRCFLVRNGLRVSLREELTLALSACAALLYLKAMRMVVFLSGAFLLRAAVRNSMVLVEQLSGRGAALLGRVPTIRKVEIEEKWARQLLVLGFRSV